MLNGAEKAGVVRIFDAAVARISNRESMAVHLSGDGTVRVTYYGPGGARTEVFKPLDMPRIVAAQLDAAMAKIRGLE